jgi:ribosomal protein S18 acetylase RimI-like enzyme
VEAAERNEWHFCSLWTESITIANCAKVLMNSDFDDDYFFNRVELRDCSDHVGALDELIKFSEKNRASCYLYDLTGSLSSTRLQKQDTMYTLSCAETRKSNHGSHHSHPSHKPEQIKIVEARPSSWSKTYCDAFGVPDWYSEVRRITSSPKFEGTLLEAVDAEQHTLGCCSTLQSSGLTGIYCLGTLPNKRRRGAASSLLAHVATTKRNVVLQSLESERSLSFYENRGFRIRYSKSIYALYRAAS